MSERRTKTVTYKHTQFHLPGPSIRNLIVQALTKLDTVGKRRQSLAPDDEAPIWRLIGQSRIEKEFVFGVLMQYVPGSNPVVLVDDEDAENLTVEQMLVPQTDGEKRRELLEGLLFFGVLDNHLVLMQTAALRADHLEKHLMWLLHHSEVLEGTNTLQLMDSPPKMVREKMASHKVKSLDIGGQLVPASVFAATATPAAQASPAASPALAVQSVAARGVAVQQGGGVLEALRGLLKPDQAAKIDFDALSGSDIEYTLRITYKGKTTENGQQFLDTLSSAFRNTEEVDATIKLVGGGQITSQDMKLSGSVRIEFYNGVPNPDEVFEAMRTWLLEKLTAGDVKAA